MRFAKLVGILALASCGVRAPTPIDIAALVAARGPIEARRDLEIRILAEPRDVQARLAAATLDDDLHRASDAIEDYEAVERLGGPLGTRWHDADKARFAALLVRRGEARVARGSGHGLYDLSRAQKLGARVPAELTARAKEVAAIAKLRHIDAEVRASGRAMLGELASNPAWAGAAAHATPAQHAAFGVWLWERGAKREAYEQLARWQVTGTHDATFDPAFARALAWWSPDAAVAALAIPRDAPVPRTPVTPAPEPSDVPAPPSVTNVGSDARAAAAAHYAYGRLEALVREGASGAGATTDVSSAAAGLPSEAELGVVAREYRRDPAVAERLAHELVGRSIDRALGQAAIGGLFDALGDPGRARTVWLGASEDSDDPALVTGYACAAARAGDGDATLVIGAAAAAASGDPAVTWITIGHALMRGGRTIDVITAMRSALDLAGANALAEALDLAIEASRRADRDAQADGLAAQRAQLSPPPVGRVAEKIELAELAQRDPNASVLAAAWVATRDDPNDLALRATLAVALDRDDPRRASIVAELVALAGDRDPERALSAALSLP